MWFKKKPLEPKRAALAEGEELNEEKALLMLADIHKLDPNMRYVFWFERAINPERIEMLRRILGRSGIKVAVITGMVEPKIYEFKREEVAVVDWQLKTPQVVEAGQAPLYDKIGEAYNKTRNEEEKNAKLVQHERNSGRCTLGHEASMFALELCQAEYLASNELRSTVADSSWQACT